MRLRDLVADTIGVLCLFGIGYGLLIIGHGFGL